MPKLIRNCREKSSCLGWFKWLQFTPHFAGRLVIPRAQPWRGCSMLFSAATDCLVAVCVCVCWGGPLENMTHPGWVHMAPS